MGIRGRSTSRPRTPRKRGTLAAWVVMPRRWALLGRAVAPGLLGPRPLCPSPRRPYSDLPCANLIVEQSWDLQGCSSDAIPVCDLTFAFCRAAGGATKGCRNAGVAHQRVVGAPAQMKHRIAYATCCRNRFAADRSQSQKTNASTKAIAKATIGML